MYLAAFFLAGNLSFGEKPRQCKHCCFEDRLGPICAKFRGTNVTCIRYVDLYTYENRLFFCRLTARAPPGNLHPRSPDSATRRPWGTALLKTYNDRGGVGGI